MATLQRSSFSFRRQGSSGRIWQSQNSFAESNARNSVSTEISKMETFWKEENEAPSQRKTLKNDQISDSSPQRKMSSSSKSENKAQRNVLSSIFGPCMRQLYLYYIIDQIGTRFCNSCNFVFSFSFQFVKISWKVFLVMYQ